MEEIKFECSHCKKEIIVYIKSESDVTAFQLAKIIKRIDGYGIDKITCEDCGNRSVKINRKGREDDA